MANLIVQGGKPLKGEITPSGYKNSVVALIPASLLTNEKVTITNVPDISDVQRHTDFIKSLGSEIEWDKENNTLTIDNSNISKDIDLGDFPTTMGSSNLLFPSLLQRVKDVTFPRKMKGCTLGIRELDDRLGVLETLGATLQSTDDELRITIDEKYKGGDVWLDYQGVGATENFIMAAVLADGVSTCTNAASEPQVEDLCKFLNLLGAKIEGVGTNRLKVTGVEKLGGGEFRIVDDYYEIATFLALGAMTNGDVKVYTQNKENFGLIKKNFKRLGIELEDKDDYYRVTPNQSFEIMQPFTTNFTTKVEAAPWPYFPADLTPIFVALSTKSKGTMMHWNKVHEGQHLWISELMKFGAHALLADPHRMIVFGDKPMKPAVVNAPYVIRVAVALYMLAASIEGQSLIKDADTIKRAHPQFVPNLQKLGADVEWEV